MLWYTSDLRFRFPSRDIRARYSIVECPVMSWEIGEEATYNFLAELQGPTRGIYLYN